MVTNFILASVLLASCILIFLVRGTLMALSSHDWPSTTGILAFGNIDEIRGQVRIHGRQLRYAYFVDDNKYISNRVYAPIPDNLITYAIHFNDRSFIDRHFKNEQRVQVFYNPANPKQSCLARGGAKYVLQESCVYAAASIAILISL